MNKNLEVSVLVIRVGWGWFEKGKVIGCLEDSDWKLKSIKRISLGVIEVRFYFCERYSSKKMDFWV